MSIVDSTMMKSSVIIGCMTAVVSSAIQSLGITLQRKSHTIPYDHELSDSSVVLLNGENDMPEDTAPSRNTHTHRRNLWVVGFSLFIVANIFGSLFQLTTLPLIIMSPLQSMGLIFNSFFSCALLPGEVFSKNLVGGTFIIAVGAFVIAYNGPRLTENPTETNADKDFQIIIAKFLKPGFLAWLILTFVFMAICVHLIRSISAKVRRFQLRPLGKVRKLSTRGKDDLSRLVFIRGILYGLISGALTAHTFLLAKSIVDVLFRIISERSTPRSMSTYVISIAMLSATLCIITMQLAAFNLGLSNISTSVLYPLCFLVYNLINLINDIIFNSLLRTGVLTLAQLTYVSMGLSFVFFGVVLISWDGAKHKSDGFYEVSRSPLIAKFPYEHKIKGDAVFTYEEIEIMGQFTCIKHDIRMEEICPE